VFPYPELLATILFSGFFLMLGNSYGNSIAFAKHVLLAANPSITNTTELDSRVVRLIAVFVLSVVCLMHYFSGRFGRFLNKVLAIFKIGLLFTVFVAGVKASYSKESGTQDFKVVHGERHSLDGLAAMVLILYAYQGWENANYASKMPPYTYFSNLIRSLAR
jgi:amino acid transporter